MYPQPRSVNNPPGQYYYSMYQPTPQMTYGMGMGHAMMNISNHPSPYNGTPYTGTPYNGTPYNGTPYNGTPYNCMSPSAGMSPVNGMTPVNGMSRCGSEERFPGQESDPTHGGVTHGVTHGGVTHGAIHEATHGGVMQGTIHGTQYYPLPPAHSHMAGHPQTLTPTYQEYTHESGQGQHAAVVGYYPQHVQGIA